MKPDLNHIDSPWNDQQSTKHRESSSLESMDIVSDHRHSITMDHQSAVCLDQNEPQNTIENQSDGDSSIPSDDDINLEDDSNVDPLSVDEVEEDCLMIGAPNIFTLLALTTRQFLDKHHHKFWFHLMVILGVHSVVNGVQSQFEPNGFHDDEHRMQSMNVMGRHLLSHQSDWRSGKFDPNRTGSDQGFRFNSPRSTLDKKEDQDFWKDVVDALKRGDKIESIGIKGRYHFKNGSEPMWYDSTRYRPDLGGCDNAGPWKDFSVDSKYVMRWGFQRSCGGGVLPYFESVAFVVTKPPQNQSPSDPVSSLEFRTSYNNLYHKFDIVEFTVTMTQSVAAPKPVHSAPSRPWRSGPFNPNSTAPNQGFGFIEPQDTLHESMDQQFWKDIVKSMQRGNEIDSIEIKGRWTDGQSPGWFSYDSTTSDHGCTDAGPWKHYFVDISLNSAKQWGFQRSCGKGLKAYFETISLSFTSITVNPSAPAQDFDFKRGQEAFKGNLPDYFEIAEFIVNTRKAATAASRQTASSQAASKPVAPKRAALTTGNVILLIALIVIAVSIIAACACGIVFILMYK